MKYVIALVVLGLALAWAKGLFFQCSACREFDK
jgi:hypothetical protein